jgi:hypothetical protein
MTAHTFEKPVCVLQGLGFVVMVKSVMDAYRLLLDSPVGIRDAAYTFALRACQAALVGEVEPETARSLFVVFAERHGVLAPEIDAAIASQATKGGGRHVQ